MSEKKLKDFLEFLSSKGGKINCVVNSKQELSAVVDVLKTICQVENHSESMTFRTYSLDKAEQKFPMNLKITPLKEYVHARPHQTVFKEDYPWRALERMNPWSSLEYQQFYYGIDLDVGDSIITPKFFSEYKEENVDSTVAEYKQSLR